MVALVGRERELGWLREVRRRRAGTIVVISGVAGVGKTSLLGAAFPQPERAASVTFPAARLPLPGFGLRQLASATGQAGRQLADAIERDGRDRGVDTAAVWRAADALVRALDAPLLCFDDAQWADDLTLSWLARAADVLSGTSATIVLATRGAETIPAPLLTTLAPALRARLVESLHLAPLDEDAVRAMVRAADVGADDDVAHRLHERTDGIPLAVEALLDEIARGRAAPPRDDVPEHAAPLVLRAVVAEQAATLSAGARRVVSVLSIAPLPIAADVLRRLATMPPADVEAALDEAVDTGLLVRGPDGIAFRHDLQREAAADLLGDGERRTLHGSIADALARTPGWPATQVAQQYVAAGRPADAIRWLRVAADEAVALHDHGNAYAQLEHAADLATDPEARASLVEAAFTAARSSDRCDGCIDLMTRALADLKAPGLRGRLLLRRARLHAYLGNAAERDADLQASHDAFAQAGDVCGRARALAELALPAGSQPVAAMVDAGRSALELAQRCGDPAVVAIAATNLALVRIFDGDCGGTPLWEMASRTVPPEGMVDGSEEAFRTLFNWTTSVVAWGDHREAAGHAATGLKHARELNHVEAFEAIDLELKWRTGRWDDASGVIERSQSRWVRTECVPLAKAIRIAIAFERERRPDVAGLAPALAELMRLTPEDWGPMAQAIAMRIRAERAEPSPERGLVAVLDEIKSMGLRVGWGEVLSAGADVAPGACRRALAVLDGLRPAGPRGEAALVMTEGLLALDAGRHAAATDTLRDAASLYEALPEPWSHARCLERAADALRARGFKTGPLLRDAAEIYSGIGAERSLARVLRRGAGSRSLSGLHIPRGQSYAPRPGLTARERDVADLARRGFTALEIAEQLTISPATARKHLENVKVKLGVRKKSELVRVLRESG